MHADHQNVTRNPQDPITGAHECVLWHGDIMVNQHLELQAAMCIVHKAGMMRYLELIE